MRLSRPTAWPRTTSGEFLSDGPRAQCRRRSACRWSSALPRNAQRRGAHRYPATGGDEPDRSDRSADREATRRRKLVARIVAGRQNLRDRFCVLKPIAADFSTPATGSIACAIAGAPARSSCPFDEIEARTDQRQRQKRRPYGRRARPGAAAAMGRVEIAGVRRPSSDHARSRAAPAWRTSSSIPGPIAVVQNTDRAAVNRAAGSFARSHSWSRPVVALGQPVGVDQIEYRRLRQPARA